MERLFLMEWLKSSACIIACVLQTCNKYLLCLLLPSSSTLTSYWDVSSSQLGVSRGWVITRIIPASPDRFLQSSLVHWLSLPAPSWASTRPPPLTGCASYEMVATSCSLLLCPQKPYWLLSARASLPNPVGSMSASSSVNVPFSESPFVPTRQACFCLYRQEPHQPYS